MDNVKHKRRDGNIKNLHVSISQPELLTMDNQ